MLPAYAGMILYSFTDGELLTGAPRVCGDDPWKDKGTLSQQKCSPRMRG